MKIDATKLREHLNAMHEYANARDLQSENIRKVVQTAKADGLDGKALRKVFVRERMDAEQRQRDDDLLALYEGALGAKGRALKAIEGGAGVEEAAKANGLHRATLARARHVAKQAENATPHDPETGEITESSGRPVQGTDGAATAAVRPLDPIQTMTEAEAWERVGENPLNAARRAAE